MDSSGLAPDEAVTERTDDVVADAKRCLELCTSMDDGDRKSSLSDLAFLSGDQWDAAAARQRAVDGRPCLTINTLPATLNLVVNDIRQNRQSLHVHPVGNGASEDVADIIEGMLRHIEYDSNADAAYDTAVTSAASAGFGFFRLVTEYVDERSFDQKLMVRRVRNPFTVYIDPLAQEADGSDMRFAIITTKMGLAEFKTAYPNATATANALGNGVGDGDPNWVWQDEVRVAEFYRIEETPATLELLSDGSTRIKGQKPQPGKPSSNAPPTGKTRATTIRKVMWYKVTSLEVLENTEIACRWIPVFPVWGTEIDIDGKVTRSGIIRHAKDPSKIYNYFITSATEEVALRTKTPFIGAIGQFETAGKDWEDANNRSFAFLEYDPITVEGLQVPAPVRQPPADIPVGNLQMCAIARDNIKATTGIYDASLGARSNETSGKGIVARQRQGDISNFHYADNLARSIRHLGRCAVDMFPKIYDAPRVARILNEDGTATTAEINQPNTAQKPDKNGAVAEVLNDVTVGDYDVVISTGPAYSTRRQEAADALMQLVGADPAIMQVAGDKIVGTMDFPGAKDIADRLAKALPPGLRDTEDVDQPQMVQTPKGPMPAQQAGQLIGQLDATMEKMQAELEQHESGERLATIAAHSKIRVAEINAVAKHDDTELAGAVQLMLAKLQPILAHDAALRSANVPMPLADVQAAAVDAQNRSDATAQDAAHAADAADQAHGHAVAQSAQDHAQAAELTPAPGPGADNGAQGQGAPDASSGQEQP